MEIVYSCEVLVELLCFSVLLFYLGGILRHRYSTIKAKLKRSYAGFNLLHVWRVELWDRIVDGQFEVLRTTFLWCLRATVTQGYYCNHIW